MSDQCDCKRTPEDNMTGTDPEKVPQHTMDLVVERFMLYRCPQKLKKKGNQ